MNAANTQSATTKEYKVVLVGNPNVGKSVIFNYLTGMYVDVSNYPGTTISVSKSEIKILPQESQDFDLKADDIKLSLIDSPGVYGVSSFNDEELVTRDYVIDADLIVNVVAATSLSRDLFLTKQLAQMGKPMVLVLNQVDEAELRKIDIDTKYLSEELGVSVIETVATKAMGLDKIKNSLLATISNKTDVLCEKFKAGKISAQIDKYILPFIERVLSRTEALLIAEAEEDIAAKNQVEIPADQKTVREKIYLLRRQEVNNLVEKVLSTAKFSKRIVLGKLLVHPVFGAIAAIAITYFFLFKFLGEFIAGTVVDLLENNIFAVYYTPFVEYICSYFGEIQRNIDANILFSAPGDALATFLAGDYGVFTLTITYLFALLLPLVLGFYFGLAILEDSGYLPRLAVLVDTFLSRLGMNGRAIIPLILGGGCVTMATVTTRLLTTKKEKIITTALLGLTIPCSAQLGVIQGLLTNIGGVKPWLIWSGSMLLIFAAVGTLMNKFMKGDCGNFISDIPPMRLPEIKNVLKKTFSRSKIFMDEAFVPFFLASALIASMQITGLLNATIDLFKPFITNILLLPEEVSLSFILGMVRRDFGAFGLLDIPMSDVQLISCCIVLTLFVPCIATVAIMIKEQGLKTATAIWLSSWVLAFGFGALIVRMLEFIF